MANWGRRTNRGLYQESGSLHPNADVQDDQRDTLPRRDQTGAYKPWVIFIHRAILIHGDNTLKKMKVLRALALKKKTVQRLD